jgi:hypothetical protein
MTVFGPRVGSYDVELAVIAALTERLPTYLDQCARLRGVDPSTTDFPIRPKQPPFARKDFGGWPDSRLPCVQVVCPGQSERSIRQEDGLYTTFWQLEVFVIVTARDHAATRLVRSVYEDALGWCLLQNKSLTSGLHTTGFAEAMDWLGESSADVPVEALDNRTLQGTVVVLTVQIPNCLNPGAGPAVFIPDAGTPPVTYPDDPHAAEVILDINVEELP